MKIIMRPRGMGKTHKLIDDFIANGCDGIIVTTSKPVAESVQIKLENRIRRNNKTSPSSVTEMEVNKVKNRVFSIDALKEIKDRGKDDILRTTFGENLYLDDADKMLRFLLGYPNTIREVTLTLNPKDTTEIGGDWETIFDSKHLLRTPFPGETP